MMERLARVLLRLYPADFRTRHGDGMVEAFVTLVRASWARSVPSGLLAGLGGVVDLLVGAVRERRRHGASAGTDVGREGGTEMLEGLHRNLRLAVRGLARQPLFTLVAAGSIAVGIGANTAVFSVANTLLRQPLPGIVEPERVVELGRARDGRGFDTFTWPDFADIRDQVPALRHAAAYSIETVSVAHGGDGLRGLGLYVTPSYFDALGARPEQGRFFGPVEASGYGEHPVVVLSHSFWHDRLGSAPGVVGSTLLVNRSAYTVVGVTEPDFRGHVVGLSPDVYIPLVQISAMRPGFDEFQNRNSSWLLALGRLADGASVQDLNTQLDALSARLAEAFPESNARRSFSALELGPVPGAGRAGIRLFLAALSSMVVLILLVTSTNVAGMFLAKGTSRAREVAVRLSLGAARGQIVQQLAVETLLVFVLGGALGIASGVWVVGLIRPEALPVPVPLHFAIRPDATVMAVAILTTLVTGLVFGLLPASRASRVDLVSSMKDQGRGGGRGVGRMRTVFAGAQVGLCLVLLTTAALFVRSLQRAATLDAGFDPAGAYVAHIDLSLEGYDDVTGPIFQEELLTSLRSLPWVQAASLSSDLPLDLSSSGTGVLPQGWEPTESAPWMPVDFNRVSVGYFETLGIPRFAGRAFEPADGADGPRVVVVSRRFAEEAWPEADPVGRTFKLAGATEPDDPEYEVVGVVADVKNQIVTEASKPFVYFPLTQRYHASTQVAIRSSAPADEVLAGLSRALAEADPTMSRGAVAPLSDVTAVGLLPQRIAAALTSALALVALLLSALGIYGVISYAVNARTREIGIRMALGADASSVVRRLVRSGLLLAGPGLLIGAALSLLVAHLLRALLLDLSPFDPAALGSVGVLLLVVVVLAAWIPARRAAWVDPAESLREE